MPVYTCSRSIWRKVKRARYALRCRHCLVAAVVAMVVVAVYSIVSRLQRTDGDMVEDDDWPGPDTAGVPASARPLVLSAGKTRKRGGGDGHAPATATQPVTTQGEQRARNVRQACEQQTHTSNAKVTFAVTSNSAYNIMYCPMCKVASTYWTRFFKMLLRYGEDSIRTPYDIPILQAPATSERLTIGTNGALSPNFTAAYKFLFVRSHYSRVFSGYIDKILAPNPAFWKGIASGIVKRYRREGPTRDADGELQRCGSDLTFRELVRGLVDSHRAGADINCHFDMLQSNCHHCRVNYDFVGHIETIKDDALSLFRKLGLNKTLAFADEMQSLADEDALYDTVTSAFNFKADVVKCVTWQNALRRLWRKLQVRGVIGKDAFPLSRDEAEKITANGLMALVRRTQARTPYAERKAQRHDAMVEIYRTVPIDLLHELRNVSAGEMTLFGFDSYPAALFDRNSSISEFGYLAV